MNELEDRSLYSGSMSLLVHTLNRLPKGAVIKPRNGTERVILKISESASPSRLLADFGLNSVKEFEDQHGYLIEDYLAESREGEWVNSWGIRMTTEDLVKKELYAGVPFMLTADPSWEEIPVP